MDQLRRSHLLWPEPLRAALASLDQQLDGGLHLVGGTVRDALLGRSSLDIDLAVPDQAREWAEELRHKLGGGLGGGSLVDLSGPQDATFRVVWHGLQVDISAFRGGAATLAEDLTRRDFTINAMALPVSALSAASLKPEAVLVDPTGGAADLAAAEIRHCPGAFENDPVRLLRAYRFSATLGFAITAETEAAIAAGAHLLSRVAAERLNGELRQIFASSATTATLQAMAASGLLPELLPELCRGRGVVQPEFHHLDVFAHSMLALAMMERLIADPGSSFPGQDEELRRYLHRADRRLALKWAALLHDIGKPATRGEHPRQPGRITFHRHDSVGGELVETIAGRLKWSRSDTALVADMVGMHMQPFHLCNVQRGGGAVSRKAVLKLCRRAGEELDGLFLLAMADSLAGKGEKSPLRMEEEVAELYVLVKRLYREHIRPVLTGPPLLTGRDLIEIFALTPGPLFAELLAGLEGARVEGAVVDREGAVAWVAVALAGTRDGVGQLSSCQRKLNGLQGA